MTRRLRSTTPPTASSEGPTPGSGAFEPNAEPRRSLPPARQTTRQPTVGARGVRADHQRQQLGNSRSSRRSGRTSTSSALNDNCNDCRATDDGQRRRASRTLPRARGRRVLADVLVRDRDRRHGPSRRPLVHRHRRHVGRHTVATITDPNLSATASAYSATINWGDGTTSAGTVARRKRQLHGIRQPPLRSGRHVSGRGHDHLSRHQPRELDRDRLGDDHRRSGFRPDRRAVGHGNGRRLLGVGESGRPADDRLVPVRAGPEVLGRRPARLHELDVIADRGLGLREPSSVGVGVGARAERALPRQAGGNQRRRNHVRTGRDVHDGEGAGARVADARQDVQRLARERARTGQGPRGFHPA